jgi:hypothetical protein
MRLEQRMCADYKQINFGIQFDWGIVRDEFVITVNFTFWSYEVVLHK